MKNLELNVVRFEAEDVIATSCAHLSAVSYGNDHIYVDITYSCYEGFEYDSSSNTLNCVPNADPTKPTGELNQSLINDLKINSGSGWYYWVDDASDVYHGHYVYCDDQTDAGHNLRY